MDDSGIECRSQIKPVQAHRSCSDLSFQPSQPHKQAEITRLADCFSRVKVTNRASPVPCLQLLTLSGYLHCGIFTAAIQFQRRESPTMRIRQTMIWRLVTSPSTGCTAFQICAKGCSSLPSQHPNRVITSSNIWLTIRRRQTIASFDVVSILTSLFFYFTFARTPALAAPEE